MRQVVALVVVVVAAGLASGCGSSGGGTAAKTGDEQVWRAGLLRWSGEMQVALNGLSRIFSSPTEVRAVEASDAKTGAKLAVFEASLSACSTRLDSLGPVPERFVTVRMFADRACKNLERGSKLVRTGVKQFQGGQGVDLFDDSTQPLSDGQQYIELATARLKATPE